MVVAGLALIPLQWRARAEREQALRLGERLAEARQAAAECTRTTAMVQARFEALDGRVDSLHLVARGFEALDPAGVPAPQYEEYLGAVDRYNDAVTEWETTVDSLRASESACRETITAHNVLADSARDMLSERAATR